MHHGGCHLKLTTDEGRITALHLAGAAPDGTDQEILRYGYTDGHLTSVTNSSGKFMATIVVPIAVAVR
ncbi:hypothetical protein [Streptomyces sp. NBC_00059]|uniref:hypothetical protein n=1 Tax=Streptomyces sp. NBC_00059 TaxID=2975635 RepID=UPI0022572118|nr:hypothetical protein [Streptomyces sp. NBC_00059]MCX5417770.1 hypothetical protein [Streptomyces sp. NBC_00059]